VINGQIIFHEGDRSDSLYLVLAGKLNIVKRIPGSEASQIIASVLENDYFGEYGIFDGQCRSAGAVADGPATLARVPKETILSVLNAAPGSSILELTRHLVNNIRHTNELYINDVVRKTKMSSLGMMLNTIVHDFRNPFTMIGLAASAIEKSNPDERTVQMCALITEQIDRMNLMAEEVLEFSRGTAKLTMKSTKVSDVLHRFELLNREYLEHSNVQLDVESTDVVLDLDINKILRVLQNLVNNATEMFAGKRGRISIIAATKGDVVEISVRDNGPGIPDVIRSRLFEPFQTHGKEKGLGLGLVITKTLVEAHGGTVSVETMTGKGTTFFLRFPMSASGLCQNS
jgi:signal transduction histidine kinase